MKFEGCDNSISCSPDPKTIPETTNPKLGVSTQKRQTACKTCFNWSKKIRKNLDFVVSELVIGFGEQHTIQMLLLKRLHLVLQAESLNFFCPVLFVFSEGKL